MQRNETEIDKRRPCIIVNKNGEAEKAMFHLWALSLDGWARALVEFEDGHCAMVGYHKVIFTDLKKEGEE